jgi:hypothetical protein
MTTKALHFKWTISRGRDTYGYNICTLLVDGEKVAKTCGGGYDMQGTALGEWLQNAYSFQLNGLFMEEIVAFKERPFNENDYRSKHKLKDKDGNEYYGASLFEKRGGKMRLILDGGCGFSSIERIANAIGIKLKWNKESDNYKNHSFYTAIIN